MTRFNWHAVSAQPEAPVSTERSQAPEIFPHRRRDSKLSHVMDSIRHALEYEHEKLPDAAKQHHSQQHFVATGNNGSMSPSLQAMASSKLNENNMGEDSHQNDKTWGWPSLGTFLSRDSTTSQRSKPRTESTGSAPQMEARVEHATFEAIDNAAESESYGWPGLGYWSATSKK